MNLRYARMGGPEPPDDEVLEIRNDGEFTLRRVNGFGRAGDFAGRLPAEGIDELERLATAAADEPAPQSGGLAPHRVMETLQAGDHEWEFAREWEDDGPLGQLAAFARGLTEELTDEPVSALVFSISEDGTVVTLEAVGESAIEADFGEAEASYSLFGEDQDFLGSGTLDWDLPDRGELAPGWTTELPLPGELEFNPERTLQVRLNFRMKYGDGIWRDAQITATAGKGWF